MVLSWNEIKSRAAQFTKEWKDETQERAEKDTFWNQFMHVFGISRRRVARFEHSVKKLNDKQGFVDLFWPGMLLVEHKSRGKSLDSAFGQALDYFPGIEEHELPKYIIVSDFQRFRLYNLEEWETYAEFEINEFLNNIQLFGFISGYEKRVFKEQDPVNIKAAELMGKLYDQLKQSGYDGNELEQMLVRLLFCLFAEDTNIFEKGTFCEIIELRTSEDGNNLGSFLAQLFQVLNTPRESRQKNLDEHLNAFDYVNGDLFSENLPIAAFNSDMRKILLDCSALDWGKISPAIFGSMFQSVMDSVARRNLGAHYTSEKNIMKLIGPLFLDELKDEFQKVKANKNELRHFHDKISQLTFLDPACGCGNFLVIAYRELRLLEIEILKILQGEQQVLNIDAILKVQVSQFYGIEIEEFPVKITEVAMWLMDHQMNLKVGSEFGLYYSRLPLVRRANITHGNALRLDWEDIVPKDQLNYILGNPPFSGAKFLSAEQRSDVAHVFGDIKSAGLLDFVAAWYVITARLISQSEIRCAFVSTNSICQGEQVGVIWKWMIEKGMQIFFAHRTFNWTNEARGKAAVHCVIIGFAHHQITPKRVYFYDDVKGEPVVKRVRNINPYLIDGPNTTLSNRSSPIAEVPRISIGNKPIDGGNYLFTTEQRDEFLVIEPQAERYFRRWIGAKEFLHGKERWCLWLGDCPPKKLREMPEAMKRVKAVQEYRKNSKSKPTQNIADTPTRFHVENFPKGNFLIIPEVSSERRNYIPLGYESPPALCSNLVKMMPNASLYHFGILTSHMHNAWMRTVAGRMKSDYRYSIGIVYNNFPWPTDVVKKKKKAVEDSAQEVLDIRAQFTTRYTCTGKDENGKECERVHSSRVDSCSKCGGTELSTNTLADLYDPLSMPADLVKAHRKLDRSVDLCYRPQAFPNDSSRVEFLFNLLQEYLAEEE